MQTTSVDLSRSEPPSLLALRDVTDDLRREELAVLLDAHDSALLEHEVEIARN